MRILVSSDTKWLGKLRLFSLQLFFVSAVAKYITALLVEYMIVLRTIKSPERLKLVSLQLVCVSAVVKCLAPLSVIAPKKSRLNPFSLQLVFMSAVVKCSVPLSVV